MSRYEFKKYGEVSRLQKSLMKAIETSREIKREQKAHRAEELKKARAKERSLEKKIRKAFLKDVVTTIMVGNYDRGSKGESSMMNLDTMKFTDNASGRFRVVTDYMGTRHIGIWVQFDSGKKEFLPANDFVGGKFTPRATIDGMEPPTWPVMCETTLARYDTDLAKAEAEDDWDDDEDMNDDD